MVVVANVLYPRLMSVLKSAMVVAGRPSRWANRKVVHSWTSPESGGPFPSRRVAGRVNARWWRQASGSNPSTYEKRSLVTTIPIP